MLRRKSKTVLALRYFTNKFLDIVEEVGTNSWTNREFPLCPTLVTRQKTFFYISLPSSKLTISLISIFKHYAIDITDPNSMQDACHMNLLIAGDLAYRWVSVAQWKSIGAWNPKVWGSIPNGDSEFFFVPRSWQDENISLKQRIVPYPLLKVRSKV